MCAEPPYEVGPRYKFFPPLATFDPPYPIAPDGYLPNSVILSKLRKSQADQELAKAWKPPSISDKQRKLMKQVCTIIIIILLSLVSVCENGIIFMLEH